MMGNTAISNEKAVLDKGHQPLTQILRSFISLKFNVGKVKEVGPCGLKTIVSSC